MLRAYKAALLTIGMAVFLVVQAYELVLLHRDKQPNENGKQLTVEKRLSILEHKVFGLLFIVLSLV